MNCGPGGTPLDRPKDYSGNDPVVAVRPFAAWSPLDRDFDEIAEATLAQSTSFSDIVTFTVPNGCEAWLNAWGQDVAVSTAYQDVRWRIVVNGEVRLSYPALLQVGTILASGLRSCSVFAAGGAKIALQGANANVTSRVVRGCLKGLYRPREYHKS